MHRERETERESGVCASWEWTARPCAHAAVPAILRDCYFEGEKSQVWALFWREKITKGSAMLIKLVKINNSIKLVPLKLICINALTLTALIYLLYIFLVNIFHLPLSRSYLASLESWYQYTPDQPGVCVHVNLKTLLQMRMGDRNGNDSRTAN